MTSIYTNNVKRVISRLPSWKRFYVGILWSIYMVLNKAIFSGLPIASQNGENRWLYVWQAGKLLSFSGYTGTEAGFPAYEAKYKADAYAKDGSRPYHIFHVSMSTMEAGIMANGYYESEL
jgi:hypothetical protein